MDVVNAAPNEWEGDGFVPILPEDIEFRLIDKVVSKFEGKFREALNAGWKEPAWVALDFTKNDGIAMGVTMLGLIGSKKLDTFASDVLKRCSDMAGLVYFTYFGSEAHWVREFSR
jgi:hypothetical protein